MDTAEYILDWTSNLRILSMITQRKMPTGANELKERERKREVRERGVKVSHVSRSEEREGGCGGERDGKGASVVTRNPPRTN